MTRLYDPVVHAHTTVTDRAEARRMLASLRETHRIDPEYPAESRHVNWCRHDGIRIHPVKGGFRHDMTEVRALELVR